MSLIIKNILNKVKDKSFLSFDGILPFVLNFGEVDVNSEILHFELITDNDSFFEIEVYQNSGLVKALTLVNCNVMDVVEVNEIVVSDIIKEEGFPVIDIDVFKGDDYFNRFKREQGFKVNIDNSNNICITIKDIMLEKYLRICENCYFGLSSDMELISIILFNLHKDQIILFKETFSE